MGKRFIDTDLFRKPFMRSLEAPYKALWIYLLCECDHAGIWGVELDVAQIRMGMELDPAQAIEKLGGAVVPIDGGSKWFLPDFVTFQYGNLNPLNRVHASVISQLSRYGLYDEKKGLVSPLKGAKDKEKEKDTTSGKERAGANVNPLPFTSEAFALAWGAFEQMRAKKRKPMTDQARALIIADLRKMGEPDAIASLNASIRSGWTDVYPPKGSTPTDNAIRRDLKTTW